MKIRVDRSMDRRNQLDETMAEAWRLLQAEKAQDHLERLGLLTEIIRKQASPSFVEDQSPRKIADLLTLLLEFVENLTIPASVRLLPLERPGQSLLLTCSKDVPFLFDVVQTFLKNSQVRFQVLAHPLLYTRVNGERRLTAAKMEGSERESLMVIFLNGFLGENEKEFVQKLQQVMDDLVCLEEDREPLDERLASLQTAAARENFSDFWFWLRNGNFRPFSYRCLSVWQESDGGYWVRQKTAETLGMPSHPPELTCCDAHPLTALDALFQEQLIRPVPVVVSRTQRPSPIHPAEHLSYLGFREKTAGGWIEHVFLGVFTPRSIQQSNCDVPALQSRICDALKELDIPSDSHDFRKTVDFLNTFPKIELFFMEPAELRQVARNITWLYRHEAVRIVAVPSLAVEGLTLVMLMPRDFYSADALQRLDTYLSRISRASFVDIRVIQISIDFVSLHVRLGSPKQEVSLDLSRLEGGLTRMLQPWTVKLRRLLERKYGPQKGFALWQRYRHGFSREYQTLVHPRYALRDVHEVERVLRGEGEGFALWGPLGSSGQSWRLQFYSHQESSLNEILPVLENFGLAVLEEVDFEVVESFRRIFIKSFSIRPELVLQTDLAQRRGLLLEALMAVRRGQVENDALNRLLLACGLSWREVDVFRGYRNYYQQLGAPFGKDRMASALVRNFNVTSLLFRYFEARFKRQPSAQQSDVEERVFPPLREELSLVLERVVDINEDRILRTFFNLIDSTVRTNFFLLSKPEHALSFKIDSLGVIEMPSPRPLYEIYVHNAVMEGVHLRSGKISRGGIRWSDRLDFRNEVLDLMKIQITKNALIVPTGSKGGFILKSEGGESEAARATVAYRDFIRGLLDLTDNRVAGRITHPQGMVVYDGEDPYLVVAADRGTARFSDVANEVAAEYDFWLRDAFASGGSHGYDHKKLGITARGAWVSVQRHFREMEVDIQRQPFSVIGIGDMSGDVFGNGMLQSDKIRLLAAFDHRHIFLDPDPDPTISYDERQRLFGLPHSSWKDYDTKKLSLGGGIFSRDAKDIVLSDEIRQWLGCRHLSSIDGPGLVRLILAAEADLLWNGGIGTYVKASSETHQEVGDRTNDGVRIDGCELRVRVVGEGGNLGFTQKGRIEYALTGGRINTDAIDNVGGVNCSDHEVNIKILLHQLLDRGVLTSQEERDLLLVELTESVCESVLADCYQQTLCLSLDLERCADKIESFFVLSERLENAGFLNPQIENVPPPKAVLTRPGKTLTRPELAVLMSYGKIDLIQSLLESDLPKSAVGHDCILAYFPEPLHRQFGRQLLDHPLSLEIAATTMSNTVINQAGSSFVSRIWEQTGASSVDVVQTYLTFDEVLQGRTIRKQIYFMDSKLTATRQYQLLDRLERVLENMCRWSLIKHLHAVPEKGVIAAFRADVEEYLVLLEKLLPTSDWQNCLAEESNFQKEGFTADVAQRLARLPYLDDFLPVWTLKSGINGDFLTVARLFNKIRDAFSIPEVLQQLAKVSVHRRWDRMARQSLEMKFNTLALELPLAVCEKFDGDLRRFLNDRPGGMQTYVGLLNRLKEGPAGNCHPFTVLAGALEAMLP